MPHASFWTDAEDRERNSEQLELDPDSLSMFPHEPESAAPDPAEIRRVSSDLMQSDPMLRTMQAHLSTIQADLDDLRSIAGRVATEQRRLEHARIEATHAVQARRRMLLTEASFVVQGDVIGEEAEEVPPAPRYELARSDHHQAYPRKLRASTIALVAGKVAEVAQSLRMRLQRFSAPDWARLRPRHLGDYAAATGAFALLVIAALMMTPGEKAPVTEVTPPPAIARPEPAPVSPAPVEAPARTPEPAFVRASAPAPVAPAVAVQADAAQTVRRQGGAERVPAYVGTLAVLSEPAGASVFVNREYVGETPLRVPKVRAGSHVVWVEGEGYSRWTRSVLVTADKVTQLHVNLERAGGSQK